MARAKFKPQQPFCHLVVVVDSRNSILAKIVVLNRYSLLSITEAMNKISFIRMVNNSLGLERRDLKIFYKLIWVRAVAVKAIEMTAILKKQLEEKLHFLLKLANLPPTRKSKVSTELKCKRKRTVKILIYL